MIHIELSTLHYTVNLNQSDHLFNNFLVCQKTFLKLKNILFKYGQGEQEGVFLWAYIS